MKIIKRSKTAIAAALAATALMSGTASAAPYGLTFAAARFEANVTTFFKNIDTALEQAACAPVPRYSTTADLTEKIGTGSPALTQAIDNVRAMERQYTADAQGTVDSDNYRQAIGIAHMKLKGGVKSGLKPKRCYHFSFDVVASAVAKLLEYSGSGDPPLKNYCDAIDGLKKHLKTWQENPSPDAVMAKVRAADIELITRKQGRLSEPPQGLLADLELQVSTFNQECPKKGVWVR